MDPSAVLRQQSRHKIHSDLLRMKNEHNKTPLEPKPSKIVSATHLSKGSENKDPGSTEMDRKATVRPGVSRLPVLAKSLHLQTPFDFSQSHCRWEEKPLAGKAKKKKPCTRPVPFNLSQPKSSATIKNPLSLSLPHSQTGTQPENSGCNGLLKTKNIHSKPTKHPVVPSSHSDSSLTSRGKATDNTSRLLGQPGPPKTFKTPATLCNPLSDIPNNTLHQLSAPPSAQSALSAETCLANMTQLSLKDPIKTSHAQRNMPVHFSKGSSGENFQSDHEALLSILRNEGVSTAGLGSKTPQSKSYSYQPQRVSIMKTRQKAGPTTGAVKLLPFSPDSAALQSILQNEGVFAGGATPRKSVCPSGRGTSVYTAQRVPVRKNHAEANGGPVALALKETPLKKWTPQRVRDTRHQPMSAMKWHQSTQQSPYVGTPGLRSCKTNLQAQQEEVVQRLFNDQEEELDTNGTHKQTEAQKEQLERPASSIKPQGEAKAETGGAYASEEEEEEEVEEEQRVAGGQPLSRAAPRESVIFFSTSKKLIRAPRFETQGGSFDPDQRGPVPSEPLSVSALPTCQINPSVQSLHRDAAQKSCALSPAVALLRKRLPPLEELRMDEEVATYTSAYRSAAPGFVPPRPRCGNPLASTLHFEESSRFVPIGLDRPPGPPSPLSSPPQDR